MNLPRFLPAVLGMAIAGCAPEPPADALVEHLTGVPVRQGKGSKNLHYEVIGLPRTVDGRRETAFKVRVRNTGRTTRLLQQEGVLKQTTSLRFIPLAEYRKMINGDLVSGDLAITTNVINVCPPLYEELAPGESRDYDLKWKPSPEDRGEGVLAIHQFYWIPEIPAREITITR